MITAAGYAGLFVTSFLAATFLPLGSEAAVLALVVAGYSLPAIWLTATVGNTLGALLNYAAGRLGDRLLIRRLSTQNRQVLDRAGTWIRRWGAPAAFFAWLPVIGDPLTLLAGMARMPFVPFLVWVTLGKGLRYLALLAAAGALSR